MAEMVTPEFLQGQSPEEILRRMTDRLPEDIDVSQGSHPYNLLAPTAYEKARMVEFVLTEAVKLIFPAFSAEYDETVDYHAEACGLARKGAERAKGILTVNGDAGTEIPAGTKFSTVSVNGSPAVEFAAAEDAEISESGTVDIAVTAVEAGRSGNVASGTIILISSPVSGVSSVVNAGRTEGGIDEETSEALAARIAEYEATQGESFVGNVSDYRRWALEVPGTGSVQVIPAKDESAEVTLVLADENGNPAVTGDTLCTAVYEHIMAPENPYERLAPVGAKLIVRGPDTLPVTLQAAVYLDNDVTTIEMAQDDLCEAVKMYLADIDGEIVYTKIGSLISQITGVLDYRDFTLNGSVSNIAVPAGVLPQISFDDIVLTEA